MFIKRGDAKILTVLNEEELTDEQKKAAKKMSEQYSQELQQADTSLTKKQG